MFLIFNQLNFVELTLINIPVTTQKGAKSKMKSLMVRFTILICEQSSLGGWFWFAV